MTPHLLHHVYFLHSAKDDRLYIGVTSDLARRLDQHRQGQTQSTRHRAPLQLVYTEGYLSRGDAEMREKKLKQFRKGYSEVRKRIEGSLELVRGGGG